jgi:hypothetical protein
VAQHADAIDWELIRQAAAEPRGIAIEVGPGTVQDLAALVANAPRVRNAIPQGSNWNGVEDQYAGDPQFGAQTNAGP